MILVWGLSDDRPARAVAQALAARSADYRFIDQRYTLQTSVVVVGGDDWSEIELLYRGERISMDKVDAFYLRCSRLPDEMNHGHGGHVFAVTSTLIAIAEALPGMVMNRPSAMADNDSKPWQARLINRCGFATPPTLITSNPSAVRSFAEEHRRIIYKSVSGTRSIVREFGSADFGRLEDVTTCPTQFQALLCGINYRVHVVDGEIFASRINSDAIDYRYTRGTDRRTEIVPAELPDDVASRCLRMLAKMGLVIAGIDLMQTNDGQWWCFEVNPSPAFTWFAECTGQPIAERVASSLISAPGDGQSRPQSLLD